MDTYYLGSDNETIYKIEFSIKEKDRAKYLSLLEKYLEELLCTLGIYVSMRSLYTVDTGGGDGAANFTELGSDYSEPGKHV